MDHDATREQLELAAVEPGGLDRLMAGDTATAQAVAAHLAGCLSCTDELGRLQRSTALIRQAVRELPSPDLRARTLAAIRAAGVQRPVPLTPGLPLPTASAPAVALARRRGGASSFGWLATVAAAVVLSVGATTLLVGSRLDGEVATQARTIAALEQVTSATLIVTAEADAEHVALAGVADSTIDGHLTYSPSTGDLVVVATGLARPPDGFEYRCWVEVGGTRQRVGKMFFGQDLAYWVGPAPAISGAPSGATFGVSLVGASGPAVDTDPVLLGKL